MSLMAEQWEQSQCDEQWLSAGTINGRTELFIRATLEAPCFHELQNPININFV